MSKANGISKVEHNTLVIDDVDKFTNNLKVLTDQLTDNRVKIKKASIKDDLFLNVEYTEEMQGHTKKETKLSCTVPIHQDLKDNFQKLHRHLAILCDEEKAPKNSAAFQNADFEKFSVRGFSIGGNDENEGITISGSKEGKYGNVNLNTPFTKYESDGYPFLSELNGDIVACIYEVEQYLFEGKRAPEQQLELFDDELEPLNVTVNAE